MIYSAVLNHLEIKKNNFKITAAYKVMEWWTDLYTMYSFWKFDILYDWKSRCTNTWHTNL